MISRKLAGAGAAGIGATTAVAALLLGTVSGSATDDPTASAYGIAAEGLVPIAPTPQVQAPPDAESSLVDVPPPLGVGVLKVAAAGNTSSATAVDLDILELVQAELIKATCDNGVGNAELVGSVGDTPLPEDPGVSQDLDLSPIASVTLNRQTTNADGTLTVDALVLAVLPGGEGDLPVTPEHLDQLRGLAPGLEVPTTEQLEAEPAQAEPGVPTVEDLLEQLQELNPGMEIPEPGAGPLLEVVISSATCGAGKEAPSEAPKPKPVETKLPVTH